MDLGRYRVIAELGRGGMGIVHLAKAHGPGGFEKLVVLKQLRPELAGDEAFQTMFLDEARLAARLAHRNIVQTNEVGCHEGRYFMVLEYLEGCSLHHASRRLSLPVTLALRVVAGVLDGLHHAHEQRDDEGRLLGVVHRDVSPQNVFITYDGQVKLLDFGVAKSRGRARETQAGVLKGSVGYMSPDHVSGSTIDRRADVFAVGVLLREMLVGDRVWGDIDDVDIVKKLITHDLPPFPSETARDVPVALRRICERAMAVQRSERFATAAEMRDAIEAWLHDNDPRGSLAALGALLERTLGDERAVLRALVRRSSATGRALADTLPALPDPTSQPISLPSSLLVTDVTPPPPRKAWTLASLCAVFALGTGVAYALPGASSLVPAASAAASAFTAPVEAPRASEPGPIAANVSPVIVVTTPADLPTAPPETDAPSQLPPNPYDPVE